MVQKLQKTPEKKFAFVTPGLDSLALLLWLQETKKLDETQLVYIDYKGRYTEAEKVRLYQLLPTLKIPTTKLLVLPVEFGWKTELNDINATFPFRNLMFVLFTVNWFLSKEPDFQGTLRFYMSHSKSDNAPDRADKVNAVTIQKKFAKLNDLKPFRIIVESPFITKTKDEVLQYIKEHLPKEVIADLPYVTFSCYQPRGLQPCMSCKACFRWSAGLFYLTDGLFKGRVSQDIVNYYKQRLSKYRSKVYEDYVNFVS